MSPLISIFQIKCVQYWPEKLRDSVTFDDKFHVTYSSNMPFAEYEIRKFKLQNVSKPEPYKQAHLHFSYSLSIYSSWRLILNIRQLLSYTTQPGLIMECLITSCLSLPSSIMFVKCTLSLTSSPSWSTAVQVWVEQGH